MPLGANKDTESACAPSQDTDSLLSSADAGGDISRLVVAEIAGRTAKAKLL